MYLRVVVPILSLLIVGLSDPARVLHMLIIAYPAC
jgi:hypothetical protein